MLEVKEVVRKVKNPVDGAATKTTVFAVLGGKTTMYFITRKAAEDWTARVAVQAGPAKPTSITVHIMKGNDGRRFAGAQYVSVPAENYARAGEGCYTHTFPDGQRLTLQTGRADGRYIQEIGWSNSTAGVINLWRDRIPADEWERMIAAIKGIDQDLKAAAQAYRDNQSNTKGK